MNYYILPKNNNNFKICPLIQTDNIQTYTTHSLFKCYNDILEQIDNIKNKENEYPIELTDNLFNLVHSYEYIFSFIPGTKMSISKLKVNSNVFYDLYEILISLNIFEYFTTSIHALYISEQCNDVVYCHDLLREDKKDFVISSENIDNNITDVNIYKFDFIFYEIKKEDFTNVNQYILQLLKILRIILLNQNNKGICIIKIDNIFYKPIIDILYIFSSLYEKINIIKPTTNNITNFEKYIICSKFILNKDKTELYNDYIINIDLFLSEYNKNININQNIYSIVSIDTPYYFLNKIDDINIIFGQQQLETIDQIINILKNKNRDDKLEFLKKTNIQKSISWCEKYKVPHNKFSDKPNIFLPLQQYNEAYNDGKDDFDEKEEENKIILDNNI
jgi:hypothetical protein